MRSQLDAFAAGRTPPAAADPTVAFGYYRNGKRVAGDRRTPALWPAWTESTVPFGRGPRWSVEPHFVTTAGSLPSLMAVGSQQGLGVVALYTGDLDLELSRRAGVWVETYRSDDPDLKFISLELKGRRVPLQHLHKDQQAAEAAKFFRSTSQGERFRDDPILWWGEITGPLFDLSSGRIASDYLAANLNGTPRTVINYLFASAPEIDAFAWGDARRGGLPAVRRLCRRRADGRLHDRRPVAGGEPDEPGDPGPAQRQLRGAHPGAAARPSGRSPTLVQRDGGQSGDARRHLGAEGAAGEGARACPQPSEEPAAERSAGRRRYRVRHPLRAQRPRSAADYFDVLRIAENELAVIIADVSGHGLSSGLRMAMLKSALLILVEETREPAEILRRLDGVVRTNAESRFFVTATLGLFNLKTGVLRLTNAGHPPTYIVRGAEVEEILLPSSALGGLGHSYNSFTTTLAPGESAIWLSDGLIEAGNADDEPFGYESVVKVLAGAPRETAP